MNHWDLASYSTDRIGDVSGDAIRPGNSVRQTGGVLRVARRGWRGMLIPLLTGSVLPALPVTTCMLSLTALAEGQVTGNGVEVLGNAFVLVILVPLTACSCLWITRSWVKAARAAGPREPLTQAAAAAESRPGVASLRWLRFAYLCGVMFLLVSAALVPYVITSNGAVFDLGNIPVPGFAWAFAGPIGLLSPIALLTPRPASAVPPASGHAGVPAWKLVSVAVMAIAYSLVLGCLMYALADLLQADGFAVLSAVLGNILSIPALVLVISASLANSAPAPGN
jgi:hypothetical protein